MVEVSYFPEGTEVVISVNVGLGAAELRATLD